MKSIAILGSTGSIGISTLDLVRRFPDRFRVRGLVAGRNLKLLAAQAREFSPDWVSIREEGEVSLLRRLLGNRRIEILWGDRGATAVATASGVDVVLAAIVGGAGLVPTFEAVRAGEEGGVGNKEGLEVVEARWLFDMMADQVEVVIHPQSIVHSMVRYQDGSIIAQLGIPDMRIPIAYALSFPYRLKAGWRPLELTQVEKLTFLPVEKRRYPALGLAHRGLATGGTMPAVLNAANEVAVAAFLEGRIGFREIHRMIRKTMDAHMSIRPTEIQQILEADRWAREKARALIGEV